MAVSKPSATGKELSVLDSQIGLSRAGIVSDPNRMANPLPIAAGPRTPEGKNRSRHNALKHGIFSNVVVLKNESLSDYKELLQGLWESFQPVGKSEEVLVEKLGTILWRQRRLIRAEGAKIQGKVDHAVEEQEGIVQTRVKGLELCLGLLEELQASIEERGFQPDDEEKIRWAYRACNDLSENLRDEYWQWSYTAESPEDERIERGYASPVECRQNVIEAIKREIPRLKHRRKARAVIEKGQARLKVLSLTIPGGPFLDRLLKYEAHLERAFDRTLNQLERLQRARLGQPVLPAIRVDINS